MPAAGAIGAVTPAGRWRKADLLASMAHLASASWVSSFIWSVADLLRGDYRQSGYGKVILPLTALRRLAA